MGQPRDLPLPDDFDATVDALLTVKPPPSGKKASAKRRKRDASRIAPTEQSKKRAK